MIKKISCFFLSFLVVVLVCSAAFLTSAVSESPYQTWFNPSLVPFYAMPSYITDIVYSSPTLNNSGYSEASPFILIDVKSSSFDVYVGRYVALGILVNASNNSFRNIAFCWAYETSGNPSALYRATFDNNYQLVSDFKAIQGTKSEGWKFHYLNADSLSRSHDLYLFGQNHLRGGNEPDYISSSQSLGENFLFHYKHDKFGFSNMDLQSLFYSESSTVSSYISSFNPSTYEEYMTYLYQGTPPDPLNPSVDSSIADYENIENQVGGDSFNMLEEATLPDINALDGFSGSIGFLSMFMEVFGGFANPDSGTSKISTVIIIILALGLVSFILNIVHSKE